MARACDNACRYQSVHALVLVFADVNPSLTHTLMTLLLHKHFPWGQHALQMNEILRDDSNANCSLPCGHLLLIYGLPGSGKSTLARLIANEIGKRSDLASVVAAIVEADDALQDLLIGERQRLGGNSSSLSEHFSPSVYHTSRRLFVQRVKDAVAALPDSPCDVATDKVRVVIAVDNMPFASMRLELWRLVRNINDMREEQRASHITTRFVTFGQIAMGASLSVCLERNKERKQTVHSPDMLNPYVSPATIKNMAATFDSGNIRRVSAPLLVVTDGATAAVEQCVAFIQLRTAPRRFDEASHSEWCVDTPLRRRESSEIEGEPCTSLAHLVETAFRKIINESICKYRERLQSGDLQNTPVEIGKELSLLKKNILRDLKVKVGAFGEADNVDFVTEATNEAKLAVEAFMNNVCWSDTDVGH